VKLLVILGVILICSICCFWYDVYENMDLWSVWSVGGRFV